MENYVNQNREMLVEVLLLLVGIIYTVKITFTKQVPKIFSDQTSHKP